MRHAENNFDEFDEFFDIGLSETRLNRYLVNKKFREEMRPKRRKHAGPSRKSSWDDNEWSDHNDSDYLDDDFDGYDADEFDIYSGLSLEEH